MFFNILMNCALLYTCISPSYLNLRKFSRSVSELSFSKGTYEVAETEYTGRCMLKSCGLQSARLALVLSSSIL